MGLISVASFGLISIFLLAYIQALPLSTTPEDSQAKFRPAPAHTDKLPTDLTQIQPIWPAEDENGAHSHSKRWGGGGCGCGGGRGWGKRDVQNQDSSKERNTRGCGGCGGKKKRAEQPLWLLEKRASVALHKTNKNKRWGGGGCGCCCCCCCCCGCGGGGWGKRALKGSTALTKSMRRDLALNKRWGGGGCGCCCCCCCCCCCGCGGGGWGKKKREAGKRQTSSLWSLDVRSRKKRWGGGGCCGGKKKREATEKQAAGK